MRIRLLLTWILIHFYTVLISTSSAGSEKVRKDPWLSENRVQPDGSGHVEEDEDDEYDYEGSSDGSGDSSSEKANSSGETLCLHLLGYANNKVVGQFVPRCTFDGAFDPLQCNGMTGECWCSDSEGRRIPGSLRKGPDMPKCSNINKVVTKKVRVDRNRIRTTKMNKLFEAHTSAEIIQKVTTKGPKTKVVVDGIEVQENSVHEVMVPYKSLNNVGSDINARKYSRNKESNSRSQHSEKEGEGSGKYHVPGPRTALATPGVLAGIVCVGVVLVLCFVAFVTFVAYKLKRKTYYQSEEKSKATAMSGGYVAGSGYGDIYGDGFRYSPSKNQTPTKIPPWLGVDASGSLSYSMRHDRELYG